MVRLFDVLKSKKAWKRLFSSSGWKKASTEYKILAAFSLVSAIILSVALMREDIDVVLKILLILLCVVGGILGALFSINAYKPV